MPDQKIDNLLNLALDATEEERQKSGNLNTGYDPAGKTWDVIVKYTGREEELSGEGIQAVPLLGNYAVVTFPEREIDSYSDRENVIFMEKPKQLYLKCFRENSQLHPGGTDRSGRVDRRRNPYGNRGFRC